MVFLRVLTKEIKSFARTINRQRIIFTTWFEHFRREQRLHFISLKYKVFSLIRINGLSRKTFLIGPTNSANQGNEWSRALVRAGFKSQSLRISSDPQGEFFVADLSIVRKDWIELPAREKLAEDIASNVDIILFESLRPILRLRGGKDVRNFILQDFDLMKKIGKKCGVIFHGSDIRDVDAHSARNSFSPFRTERLELQELRKLSNENRAQLDEIRRRKIPIFVSTQDLLIDLPDAQWLPVAIDFPKFSEIADTSPLYTSQKLRVLYLPSRSWLKSADLIDPVLVKLAGEGLIDYINPGPVPHEQVPQLLSQCDLVIDQFLGVVGVFPIEALTAGRLVMSYVPENSSTAPIINITPPTIEIELRRVAKERPMPSGGIEYAQRWHDGRASADVIIRSFKIRS